MKKMTRTMALLTAAVMTAGSVAGCGASSKPDAGTAAQSGGQTTAAGETAAGEKITLRFAWWGGEARHNATLKAIEKYQELNPNVTIEPEYGGFDGYQQKLITQLSGQSAADII